MDILKRTNLVIFCNVEQLGISPIQEKLVLVRKALADGSIGEHERGKESCPFLLTTIADLDDVLLRGKIFKIWIKSSTKTGGVYFLIEIAVRVGVEKAVFVGMKNADFANGQLAKSLVRHSAARLRF